MLRILGRYVAVGQRAPAGESVLAELVPEMIKNMVLVVHAAKLLLPDEEDTWSETWRIIETFALWHASGAVPAAQCAGRVNGCARRAHRASRVAAASGPARAYCDGRPGNFASH